MGIPYRGLGLITLVGTTHDTSLMCAATGGRRVKHPCPTLMHGGRTAHHQAGTNCHIALAVRTAQSGHEGTASQAPPPLLRPAWGQWQVHPHFPYPVNLRYPRPPPRHHHFLRDATTRVPASRPPEPLTLAAGAGLPTAYRGTVPPPLGRSSGHAGLSSRHSRTSALSAAVPTSP